MSCLAATSTRKAADHCPRARIPYDTLVIAVGSVTNDFGAPGRAEHAVPLETPDRRCASITAW